VVNACKSLYSVLVVINLKKIMTISTKSRKLNERCSLTMSNIWVQMWLQWNPLCVLYSNPSSWRAASWLGKKWPGQWARGSNFTQFRTWLGKVEAHHTSTFSSNILTKYSIWKLYVTSTVLKITSKSYKWYYLRCYNFSMLSQKGD
jgi:hypothetical protein